MENYFKTYTLYKDGVFARQEKIDLMQTDTSPMLDLDIRLVKLIGSCFDEETAKNRQIRQNGSKHLSLVRKILTKFLNLKRKFIYRLLVYYFATDKTAAHLHFVCFCIEGNS